MLMRSVIFAAAMMAATASNAASAGIDVPTSEQAAIFKAAGFKKHGDQWPSDCDDPGTASYSPGTIETFGDVNGDGQPEAVVTEGGTYCYGNTGVGYSLVTKRGSGKWRLVTSGTGILQFLKTKGAGGGPDIEIGGPGFCFPVERWNGKEYKLNRYEYEEKACSAN